MIPLLIVICVFLLILLLPVGATASYDGKALIRLKVGPFRIQMFPAKQKTPGQLKKAQKKKAKKSAKKAEKKRKAAAKKLVKPDPPKQPEIKESFREKLQGLLPFAKLAVDTLGGVFRKLRITELTVRIRLGGSDPAKLGENYGKAQAVVSSMLPVLDRAFRVRRKQISISPDFCSGKTEIKAVLSLHFLVIDLIGIALKAGFRGIKLLFNRKKHTQEKLKNLTIQEKAVKQ